MPSDKFLCDEGIPLDGYLVDIETPNFQPGPFAVWLKYELKKTYFHHHKSNAYHYVYSTCIVGLFVLCLVFVLRPQSAQSINGVVFGKPTTDFDLILSAETDVDVSKFPANIRTVSSDTYSALPFIEEDKSYLIHKFRDKQNKVLIYISEVKQQHQPKTYY